MKIFLTPFLLPLFWHNESRLSYLNSKFAVQGLPNQIKPVMDWKWIQFIRIIILLRCASGMHYKKTSIWTFFILTPGTTLHIRLNSFLDFFSRPTYDLLRRAAGRSLVYEGTFILILSQRVSKSLVAWVKLSWVELSRVFCSIKCQMSLMALTLHTHTPTG